MFLRGLGVALVCAWMGSSGIRLPAAERLAGDLDGDGELTVLDLARQLALARGQLALGETDAVYADVDRDGVFNDTDSEAVVRLILGTDTPEALPLATVRETSPVANATGVALTREFVVHFSLPLALNAVVTTHNPNTGDHGHLYAEFAGARLLTRAELSSDRRKATLFFLEPLPPSARVRVTFDPAGLNDLLGRAVDGDGDGLGGGIATFDFDTLGLSGAESVGVIGTVYGVPVGTTAATPVPLAGVTITVDGAEQTLRTTTDADGKFVLTPAPAGRFFVLIDGRTANPSTGSGQAGYYAFVGKAWEGIPGALDTPVTPATTTNAAGDIFLPFIPTGTLQPVSATQETTITFAPEVLAANPALAGVEIMVPANSLFGDNGTRGGSVGIAPVAPDKLPEPLPPGLEFPLVITVQTDGATNFDRPVPVRFPNLPDPRTGVPLPPGAKTALWSFNHDTGDWEIQGPMTVSDDGRFVVSDPGVGIRQPGWHGWLDGVWADITEFFGPPKNPCDATIWSTFKATVAGSWKSGLDCGLRFLPNRQRLKLAINCVAGFADAAQNIYEDLEDLQKTINEGGEYKPAVQEFAVAGKAATGLFTAGVDCAEGIATDVADSFFDCVGAVNDVVNSGCDHIADQAKDNGCPPPPTGDLCQTAKIFDAALTIAETAHNVGEIRSTNDWVEKVEGSVDVLNTGFDTLTEIVNGLGVPRPPRASALSFGRSVAQAAPLDDDAIAILETLDAMEAELRTVGAIARALERFLRTLGPLLDARDRLQISISRFAGQTGVRSPDRVYYLVEAATPATSAARIRPVPNQTSANPLRVPSTAAAGRFDQEFRGARESSPIVLPAESDYRLRAYNSVTGEIGEVVGSTGANGRRKTLPGVVFLEASLHPDADNDGLSHEAEEILGTNPADPDSDGDGINDGAEARAGTNPLDGKPAATGIIATVDTPGDARDIAAANGLAAIADGTSGVILFDAADPLNPVRIAQVDTPGTGTAVAFGTGVLAVADGSAGLAVVDVSDPPAAGILHQVSFGAAVNGVATDDVTAHVALANGFIAAVDLASGTILERKKLGTLAIEDVALGNEVLYAYTPGTLYAIDLHGGTYGAVTAVAAPGATSFHRLRLAPGGDRLFQAYIFGVNVFSLANPLAPVLLQANATNQAGWKQLVPNGCGLALGAVGANSNDTGAHHVSLYRVETNGTLTFQTTIVTPGIARAVAIHDGLGYIADGAGGLQVINYLPSDTLGLPPTIALAATFPLTPAGSAIVEEGQTVRITATVADDVQVRNVQFLIDGEIAASDGGFPFELRFTTPSMSPTKNSFTVQARAFDTGGNTTQTPVHTITLVLDATPPVVQRVTPAANEIVGPIDSVLVAFSEPLDLLTVTPTTLELRALGTDRSAGTGDDVVLDPPIFSWRETSNTVALGFAAPLTPGVYRVTAATAITDLAGNALDGPVSATFTIFSQADRDRDGVPDDLEALLGLDPDNPDSDGDGISDGREDNDGDGLNNAAEIVLGTNPQLTDTNGNGVSDAEEDGDGDALTNVREAAAGTDITKTDTDNDGWNDETEVSDGADPLNAASKPPRFAPTRAGLIGVAPLNVDVSIATARVGATAVVILNKDGLGPTTARPPTAVVVLSSQPTGNPATEPNVTAAKPPVAVEVPAP